MGKWLKEILKKVWEIISSPSQVNALEAENKVLKGMLEEERRMKQTYKDALADKDAFADYEFLNSIKEKVKAEIAQSKDKIKHLEKEAEEAEKHGDITRARNIWEEIGESKYRERRNVSLRSNLEDIGPAEFIPLRPEAWDKEIPKLNTEAWEDFLAGLTAGALRHPTDAVSWTVKFSDGTIKRFIIRRKW